jgi:hypothetical protein
MMCISNPKYHVVLKTLNIDTEMIFLILIKSIYPLIVFDFLPLDRGTTPFM